MQLTCSATASLKTKTSAEMFFGRKPNLTNLNFLGQFTEHTALNVCSFVETAPENMREVGSTPDCEM